MPSCIKCGYKNDEWGLFYYWDYKTLCEECYQEDNERKQKEEPRKAYSCIGVLGNIIRNEM